MEQLLTPFDYDFRNNNHFHIYCRTGKCPNCGANLKKYVRIASGLSHCFLKIQKHRHSIILKKLT